MNPWLLFIGPTACVIFPPLIPLLLLVAIWQFTDGGERIGGEIAGRALLRNPLRTIAHMEATRGPLRFEDEVSIMPPTHDTCFFCRTNIRYEHKTGWQHVFSDCLAPTPKGGVNV